MSAPNHDFTWEQGSDLVLSFVYKEGVDQASATPVDLTNYSLRMDISTQTATPTRVFTFNSDDIVATPTVDETGEADNEAVLNADGTINITVPRTLTLEGGAIQAQMDAGNTVFDYDIFLRDNTVAPGVQKKILRGTITVEKSVTLWL